MLKVKSDVEVLNLSSDQDPNELVLSKNKPLYLCLSCLNCFFRVCVFFFLSWLDFMGMELIFRVEAIKLLRLLVLYINHFLCKFFNNLGKIKESTNFWKNVFIRIQSSSPFLLAQNKN